MGHRNIQHTVRYTELAPTCFKTFPMRNIDSRFRLSTHERFIAEAFWIRKLRIAIGRKTRLPVYVHFGSALGPKSGANGEDADTIIARVIPLLQPGDILAHRFTRHPGGFVDQRGPLQGKESLPGSGRYPEPKWLGMIQHDMMLWDHGMPGPDSAVSAEQRREADINIEFQSTAKFADQAMKLAFFFRDANEKYATDYPATVGPHMSNTDSSEFMDHVLAISLRENERGMQFGAGWNPHYHQAIDRFSSYSDKDFRLGLNAAQTTLGVVAELTGASLKR